MIWVILIISVGLIVLGVWLMNDCDRDGWGTVIAVVGGFSAFVSFIVGIVGIIYCLSSTTVDEKIAMYTEENTKIEQQMADAVATYQEYETDIFDKAKVDAKSALTIVSMYPELKSDTLVNSQLEVYVANNEKLKELKVSKIEAKVWRWWTYFGQ